MDETQNDTSASETIIGISDNINGHEEIMNGDIREISNNHRRNIDRIFVSQYMDDTEYGPDDYVVTYSKKDKSVLGWSIIENRSQPDVHFRIGRIDDLYDYVLSKKILSLRRHNKHLLIDLNNGRTVELKHPVSYEDIYGHIGRDAIGFLPNGDLIQVSLKDRKIYKYYLTDKPKNTVPWKYSQINDIEIPESLYDQITRLDCSICRTKLFLIVGINFDRKKLIYQFDLLTMNLEKQYTLDITDVLAENTVIIMNKNQTLLAIEPIEFITLRNNSERLIIYTSHNSKLLIDPYQIYDEIDISSDFNDSSVITKLNRKIYIDNDEVCFTDGLDEQQLSNKFIYGKSVYSSTIFKIIQSMLREIIVQVDINKDVVPGHTVSVTDNVEIEGGCFDVDTILINGEDEAYVPHILSYKQLNNQYLVLIHMEGISIYTMNENGLRLRYFWNNNEWNDIYKIFKKDCDKNYDINFTNEHYKPLIARILMNEFYDSNRSIPFPKYVEDGEYIRHDEYDRRYIVEECLNDNLVSSKFGTEMLKAAIKQKRQDIFQQIIESTQDYSENYMTIISLNLVELCDYYPDYIITYISRTSIMLSPYCRKIGNSKNTSLHSHTNIYIKKSNMNNIFFKFISELYNGLIRHLRTKEEIQTVSFIVPFPQICVYKADSKNNDHKNPSTLEQKSIPDSYFKLPFIISITLGSIFLIFEIRQCLWNYKCYFKDIWNLFDVGAYLLPIIASIFWLINKSQPLWLTAISIILLSFKFLLFFRVFESFGIYFAIIIGVAKKVFPFLVLLFFLILGYAQAFFIVLRSNSNNDDNDPRNVATKYDFVNPDGTISNATTMIQDPDSNTNLFNWFPTSLLAVYKLLTGDSGSLSSFTYREHSTMTILLVSFTFFTVIYLMNLFIGLLNLAIDDYNKKEEFLLQKAQIIMEIELFYMLPRQRNNKKWFPDWIYYDIPITEIRKLINAIDNKQTVFNYPPLISKKLRELVVLTDVKKQTKEELAQELKEKMDELTNQNVELKQQMEHINQQMDKFEQQVENIMKYNKGQQNHLEKKIDQTKEELTQQLKNILELLKRD
ncbi:hypothetical protein RclHR1_08270007 [Rhizophagus clarus]|uniref:Ion transport domain-containing protein n=1 Tax=Rhizophagus clarus TaxID=94130 RepID=A0A2Z6SER2_9GLOM|nr:hypothetical protein RclHR1_08270007 [Rhizophagus clarus]